MNRSRRKWDDHMIRLSSKHLANAIWQPYLDFFGSCLVSVSVYQKMLSLFFSPHLALSRLFCYPLFYFQQTFIPDLLFPFWFSQCPPLFFLPSHFLPPIWLPSLHCHWQEVMPFLYCCKIENEDKLSLIMCLLHSVTISEQKELKKVQGEILYLHVWLLNMTAKPPCYF